MPRGSISLFASLNLAFGASIGAAISLLMLQKGAWTGQPSPELLAAGAVVAFGTAYAGTVTARGQRPTLRGLLMTCAGAVAVVAVATLAVSAPVWVLVWVAAAATGLIAGLIKPLPARGRR